MFGPICPRSAWLLDTTETTRANLQLSSFLFEGVFMMPTTNGYGICSPGTKKRNREFFKKTLAAVMTRLGRHLALV